MGKYAVRDTDIDEEARTVHAESARDAARRYMLELYESDADADDGLSAKLVVENSLGHQECFWAELDVQVDVSLRAVPENFSATASPSAEQLSMCYEKYSDDVLDAMLPSGSSAREYRQGWERVWGSRKP